MQEMEMRDLAKVLLSLCSRERLWRQSWRSGPQGKQSETLGWSLVASVKWLECGPHEIRCKRK